MTADEVAIERALALQLGILDIRVRQSQLDGCILTVRDPRDTSGKARGWTPLHITDAGGLAQYIRAP